MLSARSKQLLAQASQRQDLLIVAILVLTITMMVLPLPTWVVDLLLATNMGLTVLLLMVTVYLKNPLDFSTLPVIILISTVFRLSLSITTTRLILIQADAGAIIETFGSFVIAGSLIVGLVIFLIITIVQFVVITKGSERVAEVSARFTLDAMPGKQMSIDSDLRNGDIDQDEARRRRRLLEKESQLFGAMDGAMKFVKGDAIAGLVIIAVNLIGGIAVGTLQHDLSIGEALRIYSLLTVGDGLVAQIPALFLSITAGTFVTRVTTEESRNLGSDIAGQMVAEPRSLQLAGLVLLGMGFVPGFPTPIFLMLASLFGGAGLLLQLAARRRAAAASEETPKPLPLAARMAQPGAVPAYDDSVVTAIGSALAAAVPPARFRDAMDNLRGRLSAELGAPFPEVRQQIDSTLAETGYRIDVDGVPVTQGEIALDRLLVVDDPALLTLASIPFEDASPAAPGRRQTWVDADHADTLRTAGIAFEDVADQFAGPVGETLRRYAAHFFGIQETGLLLKRYEGDYGDLVREAQRVVPLQKMADVLRRLLDEGVPIRNLRTILNGFVDWGTKEQDPALLTEYVRSSIRRQICHQYADSQKVIAVHLLERDVEEACRQSIRQTSVGTYLTLPDDVSAKLITAVQTAAERPAAPDARPVLLTAMDIRRYIRGLLQKNGVDLPVISFQDLAPDFTVFTLGTIKVAGIARPAPRVVAPADRPAAAE